MTYDLIGDIYIKTVVVLLDSEGNSYDEMKVLCDDNGNPYYHVNVLPQEDMSLVEPYIVEVNTLSRVFAGRDDTVALKFANRDEWLALGIEVIEEAL